MRELDANYKNHEAPPNEIGAWSRWQGNLNADLMIVAQDWGSENSYKLQKGWDVYKSNNSAVTNMNIIELMKSIGLELEKPEVHDQDQRYFFTNAALCMREGEREQGNAKSSWFNNCAPLLKRQIKIVHPKVVVALGQVPFYSIMKAFNKPYPSNKFTNMVNSKKAFEIIPGTHLVPVFHCGAFGVNRNRKSMDPSDKLMAHKEDWKIIREYLNK